MSYSNNFDVVFQFNKTAHTDIRDRFKKIGLDFGTGSTSAADTDDNVKGSSAADVLKMFCEEAQLPNVQAATGNLTGVRLGEGQINYATLKLYLKLVSSVSISLRLNPKSKPNHRMINQKRRLPLGKEKS